MLIIITTKNILQYKKQEKLLNIDKFKLSSELQPSNIEAISVTDEVSKLPKLIYCKLIQFLNIPFIDFIPEISNCVKSIEMALSIF